MAPAAEGAAGEGRSQLSIASTSLRLRHELNQIRPEMLADGLELRIAEKLVIAYADVHDPRFVVRNSNGFLKAKDQLGT
ncbi:MAG: hypothetical protein ACXWIM_19340 [Burkholderiales bacterium]